MAYEMIRFSFADPLLSQLKNLATEGESVHLTAKRLLSEFLGGGDSDAIAPSPDALEEIRDRLIDLEDLVRKDRDRLEELEQTQGHLEPDDLDRLVNILGDRLEIQKWENLFKDLHSLSLSNTNGLERVGERLKVLENSMSDRPLPKIPPKFPKGFTHQEIADRIGSSPRTIQRMTKEQERWPEGYFWSEELKKWFQLEG